MPAYKNHLISFSLGFKLLRRDWRAGELTVLVFALMLAVAAGTAVGLLAERLQRTLQERAAELLGADLSVESHQPPPRWREQAQALGLQQTQVLEFPSMAAVGEQFLLVSVKAVEPGYPLRGILRTTRDISGEDQPADGIPPPGAAWVDARLLSELGVALNGAVELGLIRLKITRVLTHEPDKRADFYSLSPRLLMNAADLPAAGLIQPGSRVHYHALFAGPHDNLAAFKDWLKPRLSVDQRLLDVDEERPELGNTLAKAERYLGLAALVAALLSGVAVACASRRYARRHYDTVAMLRCLGATRRYVRWIITSQWLAVGCLAVVLGAALGWLAQEGLLHLLRPLLPMAPSATAWSPMLLSAGSGLLVLACFAWPALQRLEKLTPLRVLRRDLEPPSPSVWLTGLGAMSIAALLLWRYAADGATAALLLAGMGLLALLVTGLAWAAMKVAAAFFSFSPRESNTVAIKTPSGANFVGYAQRTLLHVSPRTKRHSTALGARGVLSRLFQPTDLAWRFALRSLQRHPGQSLTQITAFAVTLAAIAISLIVRNDLLEDWRSRLDAKAPNYFVINLFEAERQRFEQRLASTGAAGSWLYPVVRGRLTLINGQPAAQFAEPDSQGERALNRELNLTWTDALPEANRIVEGAWWDGGGAPGVSFEQKLAESLHLHLGDRLTFSIAGRPLQVTLTSLRALRWDTMTPNFYAIFAPGLLDGLPYSYLTSFYLPSEQRPQLAGLSREFPSLTVLDVDQLLRRMQTVLQQVTLAVNGVLGIDLACGVVVLWASILLQLDARRQEDALLRVLGAERRLLRRARGFEFALLGGLAGGVAVLIAEATLWALYRQVLHIPFTLHGWYWLGLPLGGGMLVMVFGLALTRRAVTVSPATVLREN
ncbi:MAG: FtsX-like permease family protein [Methylococcaceae bacterium]|nr:MAG: FtsX-like permease family protein [Methylococcaceae bacterium]